jgi:hypothetical protein
MLSNDARARVDRKTHQCLFGVHGRKKNAGEKPKANGAAVDEITDIVFADHNHPRGRGGRGGEGPTW